MTLILTIILKTSAILTGTWAAALFARGQSAALRHWIWTAGLVCALLAPALGFILPAWQPQFATIVVDSVNRINSGLPSVDESMNAQERTTTGPFPNSISASPETKPRVRRGSLPFSVNTALLTVWGLGAWMAALLLLAEFLKLQKTAAGSTSFHNNKWQAIRDEICAMLRLKRSVTLLWNPGPVLGTWGMIRPRIVLPRGSENWAEERVRAVLAHELAHVQRNDWFVQLLAETTRIVYWFNPLFWLACARIRRESEFACDDAALRLGMDGPNYAGHVLDLVRTLKHSESRHAAVVAMAGTTHLERRLLAMLNPSMNRMPVAKRTIALLIAIASAFTLPVAVVHAKKAELQKRDSVAVATASLTVPPSIPSSNTEVVPKARNDGTSNPLIARVLSESLQAKAQPPAAVALVVVIDTSGSMNAGQLTIAKEAAKVAVGALTDSDRFGVLLFNSTALWVTPLQSAGNRKGVNAQIDAMTAGGATDVFAGLSAAYDALKSASDDRKSVILLTDGITQVADFQGLATDMLNADIHVTTISVGRQSNRMLLADIALWGRGRAYYIDSYDHLPQIFLKEADLVLGRTP